MALCAGPVLSTIRFSFGTLTVTILRSVLYGEIIWGVCKMYYKG